MECKIRVCEGRYMAMVVLYGDTTITIKHIQGLWLLPGNGLCHIRKTPWGLYYEGPFWHTHDVQHRICDQQCYPRRRALEPTSFQSIICEVDPVAIFDYEL